MDYENSHQEQDAAAQQPLPQLTQADIDAIMEDYRRRQMLEHLTGPIVSLVLHVIVLTLAFLFIGSPGSATTPEIEVTIEELKVKPLDPKVLEKITTERPDEAVPAVAKPDVPADVMEAAVNEEFSDNVASTDDNTDVEAVMDIKANATPLKLSGFYGGRSPEGRKQMLNANGGNMATEAAVLKALRWLKAHQNEDGSWSSSQPVAMCGMALLTYLSHGETPESTEFGMTVQKAMKYLADKAITGNMLGRDYAHGIAAYALAESYGMTKIPYVKPAAEKAIQIILDRQCAHGGWYYGLAKGTAWDLSVAGWQIQALKAAYIAGLENPDLLKAIENSIKFLKKETYASGRFGYQSKGAGSPAMTGAGTLCLQLLGEGKSSEAQAGVKYISENVIVDWKQANAHSGPYGWYYQTQAMFHAGTGFWKKWNDMFAKEIVRAQKSDGHWESNTDTSEYDSYMQTCFCCLMLQVYYRYLPTYKMPKASAATASALDLSDEEKGSGDGLSIE